MSLDKDTVRKIAFLSRIRVPEDSLDGLAAELSNIIGWVEQLSEVETESTAPMTSVADITLPRREDKVSDGDKAEDVLANAPEPKAEGKGGYFLVPKVVE